MRIHNSRVTILSTVATLLTATKAWASIISITAFMHSSTLAVKTRKSPENSEIPLLAKKKRKKSTKDNYYDRDRILSDLISKDNNRTANVSTDEQSTGEPTRTLSGGPSLIFEMARRMLVWDDELYQGLNDASRDGDQSKLLSSAISNNDASINAPRWRPSPLLQRSISNINPAFRTSSPIMTSAGYAGILRRNSRKKMKPSMWRHTLRVYDKMADLEKITIDGKAQSKKKAIRRKTVHHEAALVAASKLAMWEDTLKIFRNVEEISQTQIMKSQKGVVGIGDGSTAAEGNNTAKDNIHPIRNVKKASDVTDNMILSVISACVKGSKVKRTASAVFGTTNSADVTGAQASGQIRRGSMRLLTIEERRQPLDEARNIILSMEEKYDIPLVAQHINPLAAAYIRLGLRSDAVDLLNLLKDRKLPIPRIDEKEKFDTQLDYELEDNHADDEEEFQAGYEEPVLNVHQVKAKDRGSYALLVQGAVMDEDWVAAVEELRRMTEVGLHPNSRNLNSWAEVVRERSSRPFRNEIDSATNSRRGRKKRERMWLDNWQR